MLITVLTTLIVAGLIYWLVQQLPLPAPFPMFIRWVVIIAVVLYLIGVLTGNAPQLL